MMRGRRFRCYPDARQAETLLKWIGCQRFVYNAKVQEDRYFRTFARKMVGMAGQHPPIDQSYSHFIGPDTLWLKAVPPQVLRNGAVRFRQAYQRFFKKLAGRPTIRKKHGKQSVWLTSELFRFEKVGDEDYTLHIGTKKFPLGYLKFTAHQAFTPPKSIHISIDAGHWFLSFCCEDDGQSEYTRRKSPLGSNRLMKAACARLSLV